MRGEDWTTTLKQEAGLETPPHAWGRRVLVHLSVEKAGNTPTCVGKTDCHNHSDHRVEKHPHMRGEDNSIQGQKVPAIETPPHAWGRLDRTPASQCSPRNTPTCVGKTSGFWILAFVYRKHPHMRGEDMASGCTKDEVAETPPHAWGRRRKQNAPHKRHGNTPTCVGKTTHTLLRKYRIPETPPHAWGRPSSPASGRASGRNTPTCVGKTTSIRSSLGVGWKHPHMRGEDQANAPTSLPEAETPPHAWGRHRDLERIFEVSGNTPTCVGKTFLPRQRRIRRRNTPTCVGKTQFRLAFPPLRRKHPHMRGEDFMQRNKRIRHSETPPHAWGRPGHAVPGLRRVRNTPTCVGKTHVVICPSFSLWKHPHMRGEDQQQGQSHPLSYRNTPTCVGKTSRNLVMLLATQKHPHMRGEDSADALGNVLEQETPPHAWGRRPSSGMNSLRRRNTPTCVGKTLYSAYHEIRKEKHPHMRGEDSALVSTRCTTPETPPHAWGRLPFTSCMPRLM